MTLFIRISLLMIVLVLPIYALELNACGTVASLSGSQCQQLQIKLDLSACGESLSLVTAKVECEGKNAIATYKSAESNYRGVFELSESGWGKREFKLQGKIWKHIRTKRVAKKQTSPNPAPLNPEPPRTIALEVSSVPALPAVATQSKVKEEDIAGIVNLLSGLSFKGSIDSYYSINSNKPAVIPANPTTSDMQSQNKYHVFDLYHDDFQLSFARLQVQKVSGPVTTTFDFGYGPAMQVVGGPKTDASQINLKQAIIGYKATDKLNIEAGRFVTFVGFELIESQENMNFSQSILGGYFLPFWHQGIKATYSMSEKVSVMGAVLNGWNNSYEDNRQKNYGGQISYTATETTSIIVSGISGQDFLPGNVDANKLLETRSLYDVVAVWKPNSKWTLAFNGDSFEHSTYKAWAAAFFLRYKFADNWYVATRAESISDTDNLILGETVLNGQKITSGTLTLENKLSPNLTLKIEGRTDNSNQPVFSDNGTSKTSQTIGLLGLTASF